MRKGEAMPKEARDHIRAKLAACWTPERRRIASEQTKRLWRERQQREARRPK
jgi:hypothetical protein